MTDGTKAKFVTYGGVSHIRLPGWRGSMCGDYIRPVDLQEAQSEETVMAVCAKCKKSFDKHLAE